MSIFQQMQLEKELAVVIEVLCIRFTDLDKRIDELEAEVKQLKSEPRISLSRKLRLVWKTL